MEEIGKAVRESNKQSDVATSRTLGKAGPRGPATNPSAFTGPGPNTLWQMLVSIDLVKALFCNLKKSVVCPFRGHYLPGFCHRSLKTKRTKKSELISVLAGRSLYSCYNCKETGAHTCLCSSWMSVTGSRSERLHETQTGSSAEVSEGSWKMTAVLARSSETVRPI